MSERLSLKQNIAWNSAGSVIRLACNYLITIAVVRLSSGFDAAGTLSLAMSVSNLVSPFADFRLRTIQVTDVRDEHSAGEYVALRLMTSILAFVVGLIYSIATCTAKAIPAIIAYLVSSLAANMIEGMHAIDQRHLRMDYIGRSYMLQGINNLVLFSVALWLTDSLVIACASMAASTLAIFFVYDLPRASRFEAVKPSIEFGSAIRTLGLLFPLVIAQVCSSAVLTIPKQYLAVSVSTAALGIYSSVASPASIVQMSASYIYSPLMGEFAHRFKDNKQSALNLFKKTVVGIVAVALAAAVLMLIFGTWILGLLYGSEIAEYSYLLQAAILCTFITAFAWFMNDLLLSLRDYKASFFGNAAATVASLIITIPMVDLFGMNGVSFVGVVSYAVAVIVLAVFFARDYKKAGNEDSGDR
ncbi:MAG: polysaccharide biosynthesis protein [Coriobacteriaceae bacterium]|nr:MAG: polysaccharide biosynthesis protein [Coriobacteriaceae bacterium]